MAPPKNSRPGVGGSPSTYIITGSVLIGFFLIAVWVFSAPAAVPVQSRGEAALNTINQPSEPINDSSLKAPNTTEDDSVNEHLLDPVADVNEAKEATGNQAVIDQDIHSTTAETQPAELPDIVSNQAELTTENKEAKESDFETQATESKEEMEIPKDLNTIDNSTTKFTVTDREGKAQDRWKLCGFKNAQDFIPCLDNEKAIKELRSRKHYEHRERHCHSEEELPNCLLPLPKGYKVPINWPMSRDQVSPLHTAFVVLYLNWSSVISH